MKKPIYLLAGGNLRKPKTLIPMLRNLLSETEKKRPRVAYIGTANGDDPWFFKFSETLFTNAGALTVDQIFLAQERPNIDETQSILDKTDAVFVAGGDVEKGMDWLQRHHLISFLQERYQRGILFFGLSAGSIMLGAHWVRWENPDDNATAGLFACMGIAPIVCDTHAEDDDWEELKAAVKLLGKNSVGYGIPTEGGIRVAADGTLTALNKDAVCYINKANRVIKSQDLPAA